jgi:hypothetical protein
MKTRDWLLALTFAGGAGLLLAAAMTFQDWRLNPGGLFRDGSGTNWPVVLETAASWFWPTAGLAAALAIAIILIRSLRN